MTLDQEEDQLAAAEAGSANPAAAGHKVQIRNALSLSPGLGVDVHSTVCLNSQHSQRAQSLYYQFVHTCHRIVCFIMLQCHRSVLTPSPRLSPCRTDH